MGVNGKKNYPTLPLDLSRMGSASRPGDHFRMKVIDTRDACSLSEILSPQRANVLGVGVHAIDMQQTLDIIDCVLREETKAYVCVTGVHGVMQAQEDAGFASILKNALLVIPDGMPTVWVGRCQGHAGMRRVFGPDL